jgi:hypothetical protein
MNNRSINQLSRVLSDSLVQLYRVGGLVLALLFTGTISVFVGNFTGSYIATGLGAIVILGCLFYFLFTHLVGPMDAARQIRKSRETIDAVQEIAISATDLIEAIRLLLFRYEGEIKGTARIVLPAVRRIPPARALVGEERLQGTQDFVDRLSVLISEFGSKGEQLIEEVKTALVTADGDKLRQYSIEVKELTREVEMRLV